ncbi:MAG: class I adenylate-forming enzyme family protein, partial [Firmicutes bacterium]|nr:class I adenylate-forming enzyme family protein [Bacillota bacterium]
ASVLIADEMFAPALKTLPVTCKILYTNAKETAPWDQLVQKAAVDTPPEPVDEHDPWVLVYTSGTTGRPKGALRDHYSNVIIALALASEFGISPDDVGFAVLPMFHVNSMWLVTLSIALGTTCVIYPHRTFHPGHVIEEMNRHQVSYGMFVPSLLTFLADVAEAGKLNADNVRVIMTSSAPLDTTLRDRLLKDFAHARVFDIYGSTEYGASTVIRHQLGGPIGSVGYPAIGQEVKILDENRQPLPPGEIGEVFIKGPSLMTAYWNNAVATQEAFTEDGFLTVGDMGYVSPEGLLYLVDRKKDMIIVAGENVYPLEVEQVLLQEPSVVLAAVFGIPDPRRGERVVGLVTAREGQTVDLDALHQRLREQLADYKRPQILEVVEELPVNAVGKIVRRLAKQAWLDKHGDS